MWEHGLIVPNPDSVRRDTLTAANWQELKQSQEVRATLNALRDAIIITPALPVSEHDHRVDGGLLSPAGFKLEWVNPHAIDIVGNFQPDTVYTIDVHASDHVRDGYGQPLQESSTSFRTADVTPFLEMAHDQVAQYLSAPHQNPGHGVSGAFSAPEHPPFIAMARGRPTIGSWLPANSPWRTKHAHLLNRAQSIVAVPVTREHVVEALASLFSQYRNFMPHESIVYNVSVDDMIHPNEHHVGVRVETGQNGVEMHVDAQHQLRQMILDTESLLKPSGYVHLI
jgi:hypothetical protein